MNNNYNPNISNNNVNMSYNEQKLNIQNNSVICNFDSAVSNYNNVINANAQNVLNNDDNILTLYDINKPKPAEDMPYIFCPRCNNRVIADSKFCSSCGNQISR